MKKSIDKGISMHYTDTMNQPHHSIRRPSTLWTPAVYTRSYESAQIVEVHAAKHGQIALCDTLCGFIVFGQNVYWADKAVQP